MGLLTVMAQLPAAPLALSQPADELPQIEAVDPANDIYPLPEPPPPLTDEQRLPVMDLSEVEGIWPEDVVETVPGPVDAASPDDAVSEATPLPEEGSANADVYGAGPGASKHIALVYPEDVNALEANGDWVDIPVELAAAGKGWEWTDPAGTTTIFPATLSAATPIRFETLGGTLTMTPVGAASLGKVEGATVTYPSAAGPGADVTYAATLGGVAERIVLESAPAIPTFAFELTTAGLTLVPNDSGGIDVMAPAGPVGMLPAPVAYDSAPDPASATGSYALTEAAPGVFLLEISFDPAFFASASYPVVIDPNWETWDDVANRDGYTNQASPGTSYESNDFLQVNSGKRTYLLFALNSVTRDARLVYDAQVFLYPSGSGGVPGGVDAKRVTSDWPAWNTLKWNNQPTIGSTAWDTRGAADAQGWWSWDVTELYQHYIDTSDTFNPHWPNYGTVLTASNGKTWYATEASLQGSDPTLYVTYNDLPHAPTASSPATGYLTEAPSPTLKVLGGANWPNDVNEDEVLVSFQISDDGESWTGSHLVFQSPYDDTRSFTVPAGVLTDGRTYHWRAVSRDICPPGPDTLCPLSDGANTTRSPRASEVRTITVALRHMGHDDRWAMWSRDVGNGMSLEVNQANGNLYLDAPLDSFATPIGDLGLSLHYNSQQTDDVGLSPGWEFALGPHTATSDLPIEIVKLDSGNDADVKIRFRGGKTLYFPHKHGKTWGGTSAMSGIVTQAKNNTWTYTDADGGKFVFDSGAIDGSPLIRAKPHSSSGSATNKEFVYAYNGALELTSVTDPLGRVVDLAWSAGTLESITATGFGGQVFDLVYDAGKLDLVTTMVGSTPETLDFAYGTSGAAIGLVTEVKDGVNSASGGDGWDITYSVPSGSTVTRVATITAPSSGSPATNPVTPTPWSFGYAGPYTGTTATAACLTDPRGTVGAACDVETATDDAYETQTEFSTAGLPIRVTGATTPGETFRPVTSSVFDNHLNMLCARTTEANALGGDSCSSQMDQDGNYTDLDDGGLSTVYTYQGKAPYRLVEVTRPAPTETSAFPRLRESYTYDGGSDFNGMWVEMYGNDDLDGTPAEEVRWIDLDRDWNSGSPGGVPGGDDTWGLRLSGMLNIADLGGSKKYAFRIFSDDGVRVSVEGSTILDCFGEANPNESVANCGQGDVKKTLWGADAPITVEYSDISGDAALTVKWDQGNGNWQVIPGFRLTAQLGLVTAKTYSKVTSGGTTDLWKERWTYPTNDAMERRLHEDHEREDLATGVIYRTRYTYDTTYGRVLTQTTDAQDPAIDATTTFTYTDGAAPAGWEVPQGTLVSCLTRTVDGLGAVTDYECNRGGDVTEERATIGAVSGTDQTAQTRTTVNQYDPLGRLVQTEQLESGARTITSYDASGRVAQTKVLITGTTEAITDLVYDHAGHLKTETLPDPDAAGSGQPRPVISHEYNWVDLETKRTDARGKNWLTTYDALNRVRTTTSPLGAVTTTTYQLGSGTNQTILDAPSGATATTTMDVLGRTTSEALESYVPITYTYDVLGNVTLMTDPAGITTTSTYTNLSELDTRTDFDQSGGTPAITDYSYDSGGRLSRVDGPLSGADDDRIDYAYDVLGRLLSATYQGVTLPSSTTNASVTITYNDAGEQIRVAQPLTTATTMDRYFTYDGAGHPVTFRDAKGTTTNTYNAAGWLTLVDDPRSTNVNFGYDNLGRRVCRHTSACTGSTSGAERFAYDAAGNLTQAISVSPAPTYNMTYDDDGRLTTVLREAALETTYTYDEAKAQLTSVADAAGTTSYTYNAAGQIATLDDPLGSGLSTYTYDPDSARLTTRTDAQSNTRVERTYEAATGRLDTHVIENSSTSAVLASFDLGYDLSGNVTSKASSVFTNPSNGTWSYDYDGASRLVQATGPNATGAATVRDYAYDGGGNRITDKETTGAVAANWTTVYDAAGLPTSATNAVGGEQVTYTHDGVGNLTAADSTVNANDWAHVYDAFSRLVCSKQGTDCASGTTRVQLSIDAFDRTHQRTYNGSTTDYTYQGIGELPVKTQIGAGAPTTYAYTPGGSPLGEKTGTSTYFSLRDPHGDQVGLVTASAAEQGTTAFDPWGKPLAVSGTQGWFGYQSDPTDPVTKQVDMGTRHYSPTLGRFSSRDVIFGEPASPMSLNQHVYGQMSPVTMWDPTGMIVDCGDCSAETERRLRTAYAYRAVTGSSWSTAFSYRPPPPEPAPPIVYNRRIAGMIGAHAGLRQGSNVPSEYGDEITDTDSSNHFSGGGAEVAGGVGRGCSFSIWLGCALEGIGDFLINHRWQVAGLLWAGTCTAASAGAAAPGCAAVGGGIMFAGQEGESAVREANRPGPFDWSRFGVDTVANVITNLTPWGPRGTAYCSMIPDCANPGIPSGDPLNPND